MYALCRERVSVNRFSQLYLERGVPIRDSARFRHRLAAYFGERLDKEHNFDCRQTFERETGTAVPFSGTRWVFADVFKKAELRDVLDAITIVFLVLTAKSWPRQASQWRAFVARAMQEENLGYRLDEMCVVHFHVDQEFERNRASTLSVLELPSYGAVRASFEDAYRHLDADPQDTKAACRSIFESIETMAKLIVPGADRLTRNLCVQKLKEACISVAPADATEREVLANMFTSLGYWVEAMHDYRHGQRSHDPVSPSEELAVLALSMGTALLRQLGVYAARMPHLAAAA